MIKAKISNLKIRRDSTPNGLNIKNKQSSKQFKNFYDNIYYIKMGCINTSSTQQPHNAKNHHSIADSIQKVNDSPPVQSVHQLNGNFNSNSQVYPSQNKKSSISTIPPNENAIQRFSHRQRLDAQQPQLIDRLYQQQTQNINFHRQRALQQTQIDHVIDQEAPIQVREQDPRVQPLSIIQQQESVISVRHEIRHPMQEQPRSSNEDEDQPEQFESFMIGPFIFISIGQSNFVLALRNNQNRNNGLSQQQINHLPICEAPNNEETCSICQDQIKKQQKIIILTCVHQFHQACLVPWLKNSDNCPMCRKSVRGNSN